MKFGGLAPFPARLGGAPTAEAEQEQALRDGMGDAFTAELDSIVGTERMAFARLLGYLGRIRERFVNNYNNPDTSFELLGGYWAPLLGVAITTESPDELRAQLKAKYQLSKGGTYNEVKRAIQTILGGAFVNLHVTYGPGLDGPTRSHLLVEVQTIPGMPRQKVVDLVLGPVFELLNIIVPATATFYYSFGIGFILGQSLLGQTAMRISP